MFIILKNSYYLEMDQLPHHYYEFGEFRLDPNRRCLLRNGKVLQLSPKLFDLLLIFVKSPGMLLEYDELKRLAWPDINQVEDQTLTQTIYKLRSILGDSSNEQRYIENVPKRGYRFVPEIREIPNNLTQLGIEVRPDGHLQT